VHGSSEDWSQRPDEQFQSEELRRHIQTAVDALPDGLRTVFLVRDVEGLSTEETADLLGLSLPRSRHACTAPAWPCVKPSAVLRAVEPRKAVMKMTFVRRSACAVAVLVAGQTLVAERSARADAYQIDSRLNARPSGPQSDA